MTSLIKTTTRRGPNAVDAQAEIVIGANVFRRAYGRNVKRGLPDRRFDVVRVWTCKERRGTRWVTVARVVTQQDAQQWCNGGAQ
jgi:hypothetical protein